MIKELIYYFYIIATSTLNHGRDTTTNYQRWTQTDDQQPEHVYGKTVINYEDMHIPLTKTYDW